MIQIRKSAPAELERWSALLYREYEEFDPAKATEIQSPHN